MTPPIRLACLTSLIASLAAPAAGAPYPPQPPQPPAAPKPAEAPKPPEGAPSAQSNARVRVPLEVQVVIVRLQGDKVLSRLPYSVEVTTGSGPSQLNMGSEVPIPTTAVTVRPPAARPPAGAQLPAPGASQPASPAPAPPEGPGAPPQPVQSVSYRSVGTAITCRATALDDGRYELELQVDDTSVLPREPGTADAGAPAPPVFRTFRARNAVVLRDGQSRTFSAAADRVTQEVVRVEVGLRVLK